MAALHDALKSLSPTSFSSIPKDESELKTYLQDAFQQAQVLIDSVPLPPSPDTGRSRANTATSSASSASEISSSPARSDPPRAEHAALQREWGKPVKLTPKENPLGVTVYKLGGKDGKGAWFARRSVHEGLGFEKWKRGLQREFPKTMEVQGGPGEGNIRGIGAEKRVERHEVKEVGKVEVYHLSAQFPGPTTPRDFVTLLLTSDSALVDESSSHSASSASEGNSPPLTSRPPHFMVISKPCDHPDCPPRDGFIRGQYESIEFVQEIPSKPDDTSSTEEEQVNPVEWVMITRSDPGGSVPRFMVERGTPSGIVADASKFLDWACKADHPSAIDEEQDDLKVPNADEGTNVSKPAAPPTSSEAPDFSFRSHVAIDGDGVTEDHPAPQPSLLSSVTNAAYAGLQAYGPHVVVDHLPSHAEAAPDDEAEGSPISSTSTIASFASAEDRFDSSSEHHADGEDHVNGSVADVEAQPNGTKGPPDDATSTKSAVSLTATTSLVEKESPGPSFHERELAKLNEKKKKLDEQLAKTREKEIKDKEDLTSKEQERVRKAEEKHAKEIAKEEEKYKKEVAKLEAKRAKEAVKAEERKRKAEEKDEKTRLSREKEEVKAELDVVRKERDILGDQLKELQKENTALVARIGKLGGEGKDILTQVKQEIEVGRSRSSSLRRKQEANVLAGKENVSVSGERAADVAA